MFLDTSKTNISTSNELYETVTVKPAHRPEFCSLKNGISANIDGKLYCFAHIGRKKHKEALQLCQNLNAVLPLPRNIIEHYHFIESFKRLGIDEKMKDRSAKIVLDIRRLPKTGNVGLFKFCV